MVERIVHCISVPLNGTSLTLGFEYITNFASALPTLAWNTQHVPSSFYAFVSADIGLKYPSVRKLWVSFQATDTHNLSATLMLAEHGIYAAWWPNFLPSCLRVRAIRVSVPFPSCLAILFISKSLKHNHSPSPLPQTNEDLPHPRGP